MRRFRRGLVVGKFSPLHLGHEHLIAQGMAACGELVVIGYSKPELERCGVKNRERWLKARFPDARRLVIDDARLAKLCARAKLPPRMLPHNDAPASEHRDFVAWLCTHFAGGAVDAVFTSEDYGNGFAQALARAFARPVAHVSVDPARATVPVSGTRIRNDPHAHRAFLAPEVYADFVERVVVLGGESSGKSTLARRLAEKLDTVWAHEYGRELWEKREGRLDFPDLVKIGRVQVAREDRLARRANRWLVCDTSPLTTLFYSLDMFGRADQNLERLADREYHRIFLCAPDFDFVQDGTRRDARFREAQHAWYMRELEARGIAYEVLEGDVEARLAAALAHLGHSRC